MYSVTAKCGSKSCKCVYLKTAMVKNGQKLVSNRLSFTNDLPLLFHIDTYIHMK